jgi:AcrR family transcriptional regulator
VTLASPTPTKIRILELAFAELLEKGFVGFTIQGVAERTGISLGNLTYHYATREVLIGAMIDHWFEGWKKEFASLVSQKLQGDDPDIAAFVDWVMDSALAKENLVFPELWSYGNRDARVANMLEQLYEEAIDTVIQALGLATDRREDSSEIKLLLYVLAAASEGATAVIGRTDLDHPLRQQIKDKVRVVMTPLIQKEFAKQKMN